MLTYENAKAKRKGCGWLLTATLKPSGNQLEILFKSAADMDWFIRSRKIELTLKNMQL